MNNQLLYKLQNSQTRCSYVPLSSKNLLQKIYNLMNKIIKKNLNFQNKNDLKKLTLHDLLKIEKDLKKKYQKKILLILKKDLDKCILNTFGENFKNYRIGVQIKYKWNENDIKKRSKIFFSKDGLWYESKNKPNICFPTRPHQDLSNNGFRSSSVVIFYIPLTPYFVESSIMQIAKFKKKHGLYKMDNKFGYPNEITHKTVKNLKWITPNSLKPGNIFLMDSLTLHKSSEISQVPRIALNVKIQPTNLNYINKNYNIKINKKKLDLDELINCLKKVCKKNNGFNFELAIAHYLNGNKNLCIKSLKKLCLQKYKMSDLKKTLVGAIVRKEIGSIKKMDYKNLFKSKLKIQKKSCAESILNTLG